ncbi:NAD(P)-dependent oxidoreductase [uncultured Nostoc sp.]|uniref:NAD(P)-dependent oxidoreductase n=1 Tax=uncultured Nostoc sp. TaxID=340711 RepID=UPI0035CB78AD
MATPCTSESREFIDESVLRWRSPPKASLLNHAYLINIVCGGVIDESALIKALKEGWIERAGLDDTVNFEPLPPESFLW